jgi:hypothetical protein
MKAFELREQHKPDGEEPFVGGSFALRDGTTFDLAEALEQGGGVIVTDDEAVIEHLRNSEVFKHATLPEGAAPSFDAAAASEEELDAFVGDANAKKVVEAAGASAAAAEALLAAERRVKSDDGRKTVVKGLEAVIAAAGSTGGDR